MQQCSNWGTTYGEGEALGERNKHRRLQALHFHAKMDSLESTDLFLSVPSFLSLSLARVHGVPSEASEPSRYQGPLITHPIQPAFLCH